MSILITNIKELLQVREKPVSFLSGSDMAELPVLKNAFLLIDHDTIVDYGTMDQAEGLSAEQIIDASGQLVLPAWCDSHSHIVYAGNREQEFVDRIKGMSYQDIAKRGGGILNSAKCLQETSEDDLYDQSVKRVKEVMSMGTGAIEIKSGYGLTVDAELKMLRVIKRIKKDFPLKVIPTFLGAHALPLEYTNNKSGYIDLIIKEMLPKIYEQKLAKYVDVFCEAGYFSLDDTDLILTAAKHYGLIPKIHVNQFNALGGVALGVKHNALSVDHLEELIQDDIDVLKTGNTMPVALPSCSYFLGIPYTPARRIIDSGLPLTLASDFNPGSSPSGNMSFVWSLACIIMKMTPAEALNALTINGAAAMELASSVGSISKGKLANLIVTKEISSLAFIPYSFGDNQVDKVMMKGNWFS